MFLRNICPDPTVPKPEDCWIRKRHILLKRSQFVTCTTRTTTKTTTTLFSCIAIRSEMRHKTPCTRTSTAVSTVISGTNRQPSITVWCKHSALQRRRLHNGRTKLKPTSYTFRKTANLHELVINV